MMQTLFKADVLRVVKAFKRSHPWKGDLADRFLKFELLNNALNTIYKRKVSLIFDIPGGVESKDGNGYYSPAEDLICLQGKLSVLTFLHEWGHALFGHSEERARDWSQGLFSRLFPRNWARMQSADGGITYQISPRA